MVIFREGTKVEKTGRILEDRGQDLLRKLGLVNGKTQVRTNFYVLFVPDYESNREEDDLSAEWAEFSNGVLTFKSSYKKIAFHISRVRGFDVDSDAIRVYTVDGCYRLAYD